MLAVSTYFVRSRGSSSQASVYEGGASMSREKGTADWSQVHVPETLTKERALTRADKANPPPLRGSHLSSTSPPFKQQ
jgi:hypothetical protein